MKVFQPFKRLYHFVHSRKGVVIIFPFLLIIRIIHLLADPPKNLDWSLGLFFDEGIYNHNARNLILFGQWKLDEWNDFYYSALSTWLKYLVFGIIGIGRVQIRLFSIAFSMISLVFAYLAAKESYGKKTGLLAVLLLGTNYIYLMFNRLGMQDTQPVAVFMIAFYLWQKGVNRVKVLGDSQSPSTWYSDPKSYVTCHCEALRSNPAEIASSKTPRNDTTHLGLLYCFLAGIVCFASYTFKNLILYLLPVPFVALVFYIVLQWEYKSFRNSLFKAFGSFSAGAFLAFLIWYLPFYLPNRAILTQFGSFFTKTQMFPTTRLSQLLSNFYQTPFFLYFSYNPVVLLGALLFLYVLYYRLCSHNRSRVQPADVFLLMWFWATFAFTGIIAYRPTRYFLPMIPPLCLLAARFISLVSTLSLRKLPRKLHWSFLPISVVWFTIILRIGIQGLLGRIIVAMVLTGLAMYVIPRGKFYHGDTEDTERTQHNSVFSVSPWFLKTCPKYGQYIPTILALALITVSLYHDGKAYYRWARAPEYVVHTVGKDLMTYVGQGGYIGGMDAPGVAYDTPYKTLISYDQYVNYKDNPITKYKLTHLFLANNRNIQEDHYYVQKYPQDMQRATLLQQYAIKDATFSLFSLVETRIENITLGRITFAPGETFQAQTQIKNDDFRQPQKLSLNWSLYPQMFTQDASPVRIGQEMPYWLPPEQEQEFSLTGQLPDQPGQYQLLVSWQPVKESVYEADTMRRQIGQVVQDIQAVGKRVVYYNSAASTGTGFLAYGHYRDYQPGMYAAVFRLKIKDNTTPDIVARLDVVANYGKVILQQKELRGTDFSDTTNYQTFLLPYALKEYTPKVEFRVFSCGKTDIWVDEIRTSYREGVWYREPIVIRERS